MGSSCDNCGESHHFYRIKDKDFLKATDGTYKLSIKFTDFYKKGEAFHYPFGEPDVNGNTAGMNDWWFKKFSDPSIPYTDYADSLFSCMALVNQNKLFYRKTYNYRQLRLLFC